MITEDYVSFETAKLLKEKGFDCRRSDISAMYNEDGEFFSLSTADRYYYDYEDFDDKDYIAPTLQMAKKWLRKVHNLHCAVDYDFVLGWYCQITSLKETVEYDYEEMKHYHPEKDNGFSSPEEACEAAIKYCLENLI